MAQRVHRPREDAEFDFILGMSCDFSLRCH